MNEEEKILGVEDIEEIEEVKKKPIRRTKYHTHVEPNLVLIEGWVRDGMIDEEVAERLGVAYSTLRRYRKQYPILDEIFLKTKEIVDYEVENALLKRAVGYEYKEEMVNNKGQVVEVVKHQAPHPASAIFWLRNRKRRIWKNLEIEQVEKLIADRKYVEEKTKLLEDVKKDTSLMEALIKVVEESDEVEKEETDINE